MNNANDFKQYLLTHCLGRASAQTATDILSHFPSLADRQIRKWAKRLRLEGEPLCSDSNLGYWWANTADELSDTMTMLKGRALGSLQQASRLKKLALPGVVGQLSLELPEPILVDMPEELYNALLRYQENHPNEERDAIFTQALSLFLAAHKDPETQPCEP